MLRSAAARAARSLSRSYAVGPAGQCSGLPAEVLETRKVLIYSPARSASQQGKAFDGTWKISFGDDGKRWENPLMGWTSTSDPLAGVGRIALEFDSAASAQAYCDRQGWAYDVQAPHAQSLGTSVIKGAGKGAGKPQGVKQYGDNFSVRRRGIPVWKAGQSAGE